MSLISSTGFEKKILNKKIISINLKNKLFCEIDVNKMEILKTASKNCSIFIHTHRKISAHLLNSLNKIFFAQRSIGKLLLNGYKKWRFLQTALN